MDFFMPFSSAKLKPHLKMAVQRMEMANNKRTIQVKKMKKEVADLLAAKKDEKARIKVEAVIREDFTIESYEILIIMLDLLFQRTKQIENSKACPAELQESVSSVIWAANYVDVEEMKQIKSQLVRKFGHDFARRAEKNEGNIVNARLYHKVSYSAPGMHLVRRYLEEIAGAYEVEWDSSALENFLPTGYSVAMAPGSGLSGAYRQSDDRSGGGSGGGGVGVGSGDGSMLSYEPRPSEMEEYKQFMRDQHIGGASRNQPPVVIAESYQPPAAAYPAPAAAPTASLAYGATAIHTSSPYSSNGVALPASPCAPAEHLENGYEPRPATALATMVPPPAPTAHVRPQNPTDPAAPASPSAPSDSDSLPPADPLTSLQARMANLNK